MGTVARCSPDSNMVIGWVSSNFHQSLLIGSDLQRELARTPAEVPRRARAPAHKRKRRKRLAPFVGGCCVLADVHATLA